MRNSARRRDERRSAANEYWREKRAGSRGSRSGIAMLIALSTLALLVARRCEDGAPPSRLRLSLRAYRYQTANLNLLRR